MRNAAPGHADQTLSVRQAAAIIYRTKRPTPLQVRRVEQRLECGALGGRKAAERRWTTTAVSVAEYMASCAYRREVNKERGLRPESNSVNRASRSALGLGPEEYARFRDIYQQVLKDYFLALIFRRRATHRSKAFQRAVLAGQAALLLLLVCFLAVNLRPACHALLWRPPPECSIVEQWLAAQGQKFQVTRWHPAQPNREKGDIILRVEYSYTISPDKTIDTDRVFIIRDGRVVSVSSSL